MDFSKVLRKNSIDYAVNLLVDKQIECNGTIPSSFYSSVLDGLAGQQIVIQRNALQQRVKRERTKRSSAKESTTPTPNPTPPIAEVVVTTRKKGGRPKGTGAVQRKEVKDKYNKCLNEITRKKGDRPKGTGAVQRKEVKDRYNKCLNEITKAYVAELTINRVLNTSKVGMLRNIIAEKKIEFNITTDISEHTIKSRAKRHMKDPATHKLESNHPGISSPLAVVELAVLEIILQRQKIRQPMTKTEVIKTMNDAIKGTRHEDEFRRVKSERVPDALDVDVVGAGWYAGFLKRHKIVLASTKRDILKKNADGVAALRSQFGHERDHHFLPFNFTQCGTYLQYKKQPGRKDGAMPKSLDGRRQRCLEWIDRNSPSQSFDDDEDDVIADDDDDAVDEDEAAVACYDMQNTVDIDGNDEKATAAM